MARALSDLKNEISSLSDAEKEELLDFLLLDIESPPEDVRELVREFCERVERTNRRLDGTIKHLEGLDERLEQGRIKAREEVLRSDYRWPFPEPPGSDPSQ